MARKVWSDEAIDRLRQLAAEGHSYATAAAEFGTSRHAVSGIATRKGIKFQCTYERFQEQVATGVKRYWDQMSDEARSEENRKRFRYS